MTDLVDTLTDAADRIVAGSPLDRIRQRRADLEHGILLDVPIPGYEGELVARFARLSPEELKEASEEVVRTRSKPADAQLTAAAAIVTRHVKDITFVNASGQHLPLDPDDPEPLRFDERLARLMRLTLPPDWNPRLVLLAVLTRGNEAGVQGMAVQLLSWSSGISEEAKETLMGESSATLP